MTAILDGLFHRVGEVSVRQEIVNECLTQILEGFFAGILHGVFAMDADLSVRKGCCMEYLTGMVDWVFDRDAGRNTSREC